MQKTPFVVGTDASDAELSSFFKEWQTAPPLRMFTEAEQEQQQHQQEEESLEDSLCINEQIKCFEDCVDEYEDLVKSLHLDDQSSQELG